jgi:hypothetical protein
MASPPGEERLSRESRCGSAADNKKDLNDQIDRPGLGGTPSRAMQIQSCSANCEPVRKPSTNRNASTVSILYSPIRVP